MQVSSSSWHVRVYRWWYGHKYGTNGRSKQNSNLCPYFRAVMIWAPLRAIFWDWITFNVGKRKIPLNVFIVPIFMYSIPQPLGYINYHLKMWAWCFVIVITILIVVASALFFFVNWFEGYVDRKAREHYRKNQENLSHVVDNWDAEYEKMKKQALRRERWKKMLRPIKDFFTLLGAYLRTGHDRICPEIQFIDEEESSSPKD